MGPVRALPGNRRLVVLVVAVAVALLAIALLVRALGGGDEAPPQRAASLFPETTLVAATVATDGDRDATKRAAGLAERFGSYDRQRDALLRRLSGGEDDVDVDKDVKPWLGDEAAIALVDTGEGTAGSIVAIAVTDEDKAREFLDRNPRAGERRPYKGVETRRYGSVTTAFVDGFMVIGQDATVQMAIDRAKDPGGTRSLEEEQLFEQAMDGLPENRAASAYLTAAGLRRLLAPQGGVVGGLSVLLDQPALESVGVALEARDDQARLVAHSILDPAIQKRRPSPFKRFEPELLDAVPSDALAYLGASGISGALERIVATAAGGGAAGGVGPILDRLRRELERRTGGRLERDLLRLFDGEVALVILRETPAPVFALITATDDEDATKATLARLRDPLAALLRPKGEQALEWKREVVAGKEAYTLRVPSGAGVTYSVFDGRLVLATAPEGIRRIAESDRSLAEDDDFEKVLSDRPDRVGTLGFLDFNQLLELGEQTGLNDSRAYLAAREDLQRIRAVGVHSSGSEGETTAEILVSIP